MEGMMEGEGRVAGGGPGGKTSCVTRGGMTQ